MIKMQMVTTGEMVFWIVLGIIALLCMLAVPFVDNYYRNKDMERVFGKNENL